MLCLLVSEMMDGDDHALGKILKVLGLLFNMFYLTPFLSPCTITILFFFYFQLALVLFEEV